MGAMAIPFRSPFHGLLHNRGVTGMKAAGDIRRGQDFHVFFVSAVCQVTKAFPYIRIKST